MSTTAIRVESLRAQAAAHRTLRDQFARMGDAAGAARHSRQSADLDWEALALCNRAARTPLNAAAWMSGLSVHQVRR